MRGRRKSVAPSPSPAATHSPVSLSLVLKQGDVVRVAISEDVGACIGRAKGTVLIDLDGIEFRARNQKKPKGRKLTWQTMSRLMEVGFI
jgi:hypothetical protein